jgi:hypothetical protein
VVSLTPRPLYHQGKSPWHLLDRMLGGPQSRSGRGGEEKNSQPPPVLHKYGESVLSLLIVSCLSKAILTVHSSLAVPKILK